MEIKVWHQPDSLPERKSPSRAEWVGPKEGRDSIDIYVERKALEKARADGLKRGTKVEAGGIFVGKRYMDSVTGTHQCTEIVDYVPAEHTEQNVAELTFTADTWVAAQRATEAIATNANDPSIVPIGWFHTHPGYGIFLSEGKDQFIQDRYFPNPGLLAVVFDPLQDQLGIFSSGGSGSKYGTVRRHSGYYVFDATKPEESQIEIKVHPPLHQEVSEERFHQAVDNLNTFLQVHFEGRKLTKEENTIVRTWKESGLNDEVLGYIADNLHAEIAKLRTLSNPADRQTAIEKAKDLKELSEAHKLVREQKYG